MAQGNMLQGQSRGKVGDIVFYVRNGKQEQRVRNRKPANPRTTAQMQQRVKLAAAVAFYKRQSSFLKFAYVKKEKESDYNAFVRLNINRSPYFTKQMVMDQVVIPAPWILSTGPINAIKVAEVTPASASVGVVINMEGTATSTWGDLRKNYELEYGDMVTLIVYQTDPGLTSSLNKLYKQHIFTQGSDGDVIASDWQGVSLVAVNNQLSFSVGSGSGYKRGMTEVGAAVIVSRYNGRLECSDSTIVLNEAAKSEYMQYRSVESKEAAMGSYGRETDAILDPRDYLVLDIDEDGELSFTYFNGVYPSPNSVNPESRTAVGAQLAEEWNTDDNGYIQLIGPAATSTATTDWKITPEAGVTTCEIEANNGEVFLHVKFNTSGTYSAAYKGSPMFTIEVG